MLLKLELKHVSVMQAAQAQWAEHKHALVQRALVDVDGRRARLQAPSNFERRLAARELQVERGKAVFVGRAAQVGLYLLEVGKSRGDATQVGVIARDVRAPIVTRDEAAQRDQQRDDFFARNFEAASNPVAREARQPVPVDQVRWRIPG